MSRVASIGSATILMLALSTRALAQGLHPHDIALSSEHPAGWTAADEKGYEAELLKVLHAPQSAARLKKLRQLQASPGGRSFWLKEHGDEARHAD
jgi:hypothetical protein